MRASGKIKIMLMTLGTLFLGYAAYLRSQLEDENLFVVLGVITIILGVMTFFFGESEEKIVQEDEE